MDNERKETNVKNVLIVSGHPRIEDDSVSNRTILAELAGLLPGAEIDRLGTLYPTYEIDVVAEQAKLVAADVVVLQYPVWWYHFPSLMQKWVEDVFQHGFSHGSTGKALSGKKLVVSLTTGAPEEAYSPESGFCIETFLAPVKATCVLTGMDYAGHVCTYGVSYLSHTDAAARMQIADKARGHAERVAQLVGGLR